MISSELCKIRGEAEGEFEMRLDNIDMPEETLRILDQGFYTDT